MWNDRMPSRSSVAAVSKLSRLVVLLPGLALVAGCGGTDAEYRAVHELVPDAHVLYLGRHMYVAKSTFGEFSLITMDESGEVVSMEKLF